MPDIFHFGQCPYCAAGRGDIAIACELKTVTRPPTSGVPPTAPPTPCHPFVIFNPAYFNRSPCEHLLQLRCTCSIKRTVDKCETLCATPLDWQHPDFEGIEGLGRVWAYLDQHREPLPHPSAAFRHEFICRSCLIQDSRPVEEDDFSFDLAGSVLFANSVEKFLIQLRALTVST